MTKAFAETLLFASVAINAALLIYFAGVHRKMMNAVDGATFRHLTGLLVQFSTKSPFMIIALNLPFIGAIPYYYFYGFGNWWLTAGLVLWLVSGSVAKFIKLPVYKAIADPKNEGTDQIAQARHKLNLGNSFQAVCYSVAVALMALGLF